MIREVEKKAKVAVCRRCYGTGRLVDRVSGVFCTCDQCEGTGRVTVSTRTTYDIRPYNPKRRDETG